MRRLGLAIALVVLAGSASACGSHSVSGAVAQLSAWVSTTQLGNTVAGLQQDTAKISLAIDEHKDRLTLQTLCGILLVDVEAANSNLPAPDVAANEQLANGLERLGDGAHQCYQGAAGTATLFAAAKRSWATGLVDLAAGISVIEGKLGRPIPTTTTTTTAP